MEILIVVFLNVAFLVVIYITLSRKISRIERRSLPEDLQAEMDSIITTFNRTADRNIDLLDDRVRSLEPLVTRGGRLADQLEGIVRRAEALSRLREMIQPREGEQESVASGPPVVTGPPPAPAVAMAYRAQTGESPVQPAPVAPEKPEKPEKPKKRTRKTPDDVLREMSAAGRDPNEIARALGIPREEVLIKQKLARLSE
ncbi:MAG TPA: hypothetical protein PLM00_05645 [Spirochaetota bacterium]|nr:hypothetical protein [Spirochaetota bacterium]HPN82855.1 hypothetical protein [Spirochaetota bacterium]